MHTWSRFASFALICTGAGLGEAQRPTIRDSAGIQIVTSAAPALSAAQALRIDTVPRLVIGTQPGAPYELSRVAGAVRLADGSIVVADGGSLQLRFYDARGGFIKAVGGRGSGPGEFERIESLARLRGDTLVVRAGTRAVSFFDGTERFLFGLTPSSTPGPARPGLRIVLAAFVDGSTVVAPIVNPPPRERGARWLETFPVSLVDRRNAVISSLGDLPMSIFVMDDHPRPPWFAAPLSFANNDDTFFIGLGTEYSIRVYGRDGRLARIVRRRWTPVTVTSSDIDTYVVEWGKRWIRTTGAEAERQRADLRDDPYEKTVPAFSRLIADGVGRLWARTPNLADAPGAGQLNTSPLVPSVWSVFDREGGWLCDVTLPRAFQPHDIGEDYVLGVARDDDGVQTVVELPLRAPSATRR